MENSFIEDNEEQETQPPPSHHPLAPSDESFDISTTVDPSYVISLIRRLLVSDVKDGENVTGRGLVCENSKTVVTLPENREAEAMDSSENSSKLEGPQLGVDDENQGRSAAEETWEECGCVLWDLAASEDHAQFMVQNLILDVLLANLTVSKSSRITEIGLGIIGNLACHEFSRKRISSTEGLIRVILNQLLLDDVPCLCEACRVITLCLQGSEGIIWAEALQSEQLLPRILWIAENALNPLLIEKTVGFILAVLESQQEVVAFLLPLMLELDLSSLLIKLLAFEMSKLKEELPERYHVLDLILQAIEAISTMDKHSQEICLNKNLQQLVKELIELPDKFEISNSCVTAAVLMSNIIVDATHLASELSQDMNVLQGLFDVFPFASDDIEARSAIWSIIARFLVLVQESEMSPSNLHILVSILTSKLDLIEDALLHHEGESSTTKESRKIAMKRIWEILVIWKSTDDKIKSMPYCINEEDVDKLLDQCCKATRTR